MRSRSNLNPRPSGHNEQRSPHQLGVMDVVRRREGGFHQIVELLIKRGLLSKFRMVEGYSLFQKIKEDPWVVQRSKVLAAKNRPYETPGVHAAHQYGTQVIRSASATEIKSLKERIGA
jgi:hypothetical protein